jgi:TolA-binding protein
MSQTMTYGLTFLLVLSLAIFVIPEGVGASAAVDDGTDLMTTVTAVSERQSDGKHDLIIQGNGQIPPHSAWLHTSPPKIIIDLHHAVPAFKSIVQPISFPEATSIRIGCHPSSIRVVIDLSGPENHLFSTAVHENTLVITLNDDTLRGNGSETGLESHLTDSGTRTPPASIEDEAPPQATPLFNAAEYLVDLEGSTIPQAFGNGVSAYRSGNWSAAFANLNRFLDAAPNSPLVEKACFLAAKAFDRMHSDDIGSHYTRVKQQYEDAIYRFPESVLVTDAYYAIAALSFRVGMVSQSLGYCNLVVKLDKQDHATLAATMLKATLLSSVGKKEDALRIYQTVQQQYPHLPEGTRATIETAEILFEKNHFRESLDILKTLIQDPENATQHPQLSRVLGNNYYQLADFDRAREHLLRYYNTNPGAADSHLVLARIADAYHQEGGQGEGRSKILPAGHRALSGNGRGHDQHVPHGGAAGKG